MQTCLRLPRAAEKALKQLPCREGTAVDESTAQCKGCRGEEEGLSQAEIRRGVGR